MSDITPGPWELGEDVGTGAYVITAEARDICIVDNHYGDAEANAKAIAALPELLEALEALLENAELDALNEESADLDEAIRLGRKALDEAGRLPLGVTRQ